MDYVPSHTLISKQAFTIYKSFTLDVSKNYGWRKLKLSSTIMIFQMQQQNQKSYRQVSLGLCSMIIHRRREIKTEAFYLLALCSILH